MSSLNGRVKRIEQQVEEQLAPSEQTESSLFVQWFQMLHDSISQVYDWNDPPLSCMQMKDGQCTKWVINITMWHYWIEKLNIANGREIIAGQFSDQSVAIAAFKLGAKLAKQAYEKVINGNTKPDKT